MSETTAGPAMGGQDWRQLFGENQAELIAHLTLEKVLLNRESTRLKACFLADRLVEEEDFLAIKKTMMKGFPGVWVSVRITCPALAGDVAAYIPTNVISITDGQIYLENELFFSGIRPAVNVGLSVSRVGSAAQGKIMRQVSSGLRMDLAQYRELEVFTQFGSDLDKATLQILRRGKARTDMLIQALNHPYQLYEEVLILFAAYDLLWEKLPEKKVNLMIGDYLYFVTQKAPNLVEKLKQATEMTDALKEEMHQVAEDFAAQYKK